ncbi:GntR family transcriptional regulator [Bifidobacterium subtile]|jgi:GntR family transcriptional regulator|uniref:GntR family transcriptional regulator n=1 Tax=Bifidobacterium subtile TaxID=77635 RepID=UPI002F35A32C
MIDGIPKYVTVRDNLRERMRSMDPGEQLPSESDLCEQYRVSRITLRHAVEDLIQEGLLVRRQGRGTFRTEGGPNTEHEVISDHILGFYRQQQDLGNVVRTKVVGNELVSDPEVANRLGLADDASLIRIERLRYVGSNLKQHVVTFLPATRFSKVLREDFSNGSLYAFLESQYAVRLVENEIVVRLQPIHDDIAGYFGVDDGTPVLAMDSTVFDEFGSIIAFGVALHPPRDAEVRFVIRAQKDVGPVQE